MAEWIFHGWEQILRVIVVGVLGYAAMVLILRASGKRTLAKLNAFDLVVTVALGSTLASILLSETVALSEGVAAIATLVACQYAVALASVRSRRLARLVRSEPELLLRGGEICPGALHRARVSEADLRAVLRTEGVADPGDVAAVILESDGTFSVIESGTPGTGELTEGMLR
ncbi:DUF421 domain-containing protein [Histidinibacterium lentulum]|uniref:DUF421 domain-containing protein n=2 Tax=Histidinibacterium lentulum TaxID=2480588 RepID=A0A3N2QYH3_9RHOB|nr:YetF domain-containing protein [Histidinibacterium lentulum]ROU00239.1 DUF421 domain-containing protein [Histidinibacterium lentulum]